MMIAKYRKVFLVGVGFLLLNIRVGYTTDPAQNPPIFYFDNLNTDLANEHYRDGANFYPIDMQNSNEQGTNISIPDEELFTLTVNTNFDMGIIWIYNSQTTIFDNPLNNQFIVDLPQGIYNIFTAYAPSLHQATIVVRDSLILNSNMTIEIDKNKAIHTAIYHFTRESGEELHINALVWYLLYDVFNRGVALNYLNIDSTAMVMHYNKIPEYLIKNWAAKGKQNDNGGNLYLLNDEAFYPQSDTIITNNPINFAHAEFHYNLPDSIPEQTSVQVGTKLPDFHYYPNDPILRHPVEIDIYQDTSANIERFNSVFGQSVNITTIHGQDMVTPFMRIGRDYVKGYFTPAWFDSPLPFSMNKIVYIGRTPTYWFGKFENAQDSIKIRGEYDQYDHHQLFLSMTNDVLKHFPIDYTLYQNGTLIDSGSWSPILNNHVLILGFDTNELTFGNVSGNIEMVITDDKSEVAGHPASTIVSCGFDLNRNDKNPPNMVLFQIISENPLSPAENEITHILKRHNNNRIRFIIRDDDQIGTVRIYYNRYGEWGELPVLYNDPFREVQLPDLSTGYYSLRLIAHDLSQNYIDCVMEPAFEVIGPTDIKISKQVTIPDKLQLLPNYPNPFNSETIIPFVVPTSVTAKIDISVYNLLGEKIATLFEGWPGSGAQKVVWKGYNEFGQLVSSGIYIIQMKGGDIVRRQKAILLK